MASTSQEGDLAQADAAASKWPDEVDPYLVFGKTRLYTVGFVADESRLQSMLKTGRAPHSVYDELQSEDPHNFAIVPLRDINDLAMWIREKKSALTPAFGVPGWQSTGTSDSKTAEYFTACIRDAVAWMEFFGLQRPVWYPPTSLFEADSQLSNMLAEISRTSAEVVIPRNAERVSFEGLIGILDEFQTNERARDRVFVLPDSAVIGKRIRELWLSEINRCLNETYRDITESELSQFMRPEMVNHAGYTCPTFIDLISTSIMRLKQMIIDRSSVGSATFVAEWDHLMEIDTAYLRAAVLAEVRFIQSERPKKPAAKPPVEPKKRRRRPESQQVWKALEAGKRSDKDIISFVKDLRNDGTEPSPKTIVKVREEWERSRSIKE